MRDVHRPGVVVPGSVGSRLLAHGTGGLQGHQLGVSEVLACSPVRTERVMRERRQATARRAEVRGDPRARVAAQCAV